MKEVKQFMIILYGEICFMGGSPDKNDTLTYHHIIERCDGGEYTIENGALLTRSMHDVLNMFCMYKPDIAEQLNNNFQLYKKTQDKHIIIENLKLTKQGLEELRPYLSRNQKRLARKYL